MAAGKHTSLSQRNISCRWPLERTLTRIGWVHKMQVPLRRAAGTNLDGSDIVAQEIRPQVCGLS